MNPSGTIYWLQGLLPEKWCLASPQVNILWSEIHIFLPVGVWLTLSDNSAYFCEATEAGTSYVCHLNTVVTIESYTRTHTHTHTHTHMEQINKYTWGWVWVSQHGKRFCPKQWKHLFQTILSKEEYGAQPYSFLGKRLPPSLDLRAGIWTREETEVALESHPLNDKRKQKPCRYHF